MAEEPLGTPAGEPGRDPLDTGVAHVARVYNYWLGGSYLVVSHPAIDIDVDSMKLMAGRLNRLMVQRVTLRRHAEVAAFFDGLELVPPGVVRIPEWRPDAPEDMATPATMWGGVGRKP
jgi:S-adenosyl methyltransferase